MTKNLDGKLPTFDMDRFRFFHPGGEENYAPMPIVTRGRKTHQFCFLLGAEDPEMDEIEKILRENGEAFLHARRHGERVKPWNAYEADTVDVPSGATLVLVECEPKKFNGKNGILRRIDHHREGDDGFTLLPENFWLASSIGQLYKLLNSVRPASEQLVPKQEHLVLAAMDHCLAQAMLGNCPGVSPEEVRKLSVEYTANRRGLHVDAVRSCIHRMREQIWNSPIVTIGKQDVLDLSGVTVGPGYSLDYVCLQQAIVELGLTALIKTRNSMRDQPKIILYGAATPETVVAFMNSYAPAHDLINVYGVPSRGHAGGYCH